MIYPCSEKRTRPDKGYFLKPAASLLSDISLRVSYTVLESTDSSLHCLIHKDAACGRDQMRSGNAR